MSLINSFKAVSKGITSLQFVIQFEAEFYKLSKMILRLNSVGIEANDWKYPGNQIKALKIY